MRMTKAEIEESINFVFGECIRFAKMTIAELQQRPRPIFSAIFRTPAGGAK
jgi:hypothetical protein